MNTKLSVGMVFLISFQRPRVVQLQSYACLLPRCANGPLFWLRFATMNGLQKKKNDLIYDLLCLQLGHAGQCLREWKSFVLSFRLWKKKFYNL